MLRIALFLALVAGASAETFPAKVNCTSLAMDNTCEAVEAAALTAATSTTCTSSVAPAKDNKCVYDSSEKSCGYQNPDNGLNIMYTKWFTAEQQACFGSDTILNKTNCKAKTGCVWIAKGGNETAEGSYCYVPNDGGLEATASSKGANKLQMAFVRQNFFWAICDAIAKDKATCNADARCTWNFDGKCVPSVNNLINNLVEGGCTTEADTMAKAFSTTTAAATAAVASGAAGFSSLAVVVSALLAALSLIA